MKPIARRAVIFEGEIKDVSLQEASVAWEFDPYRLKVDTYNQAFWTDDLDEILQPRTWRAAKIEYAGALTK
tara:strand:+ start:1017 stop:1229 length:213 start_codon:yes stop_codon:yes gene_type:complete